MKKIILSLTIIALSISLQAQTTRYVVKLKNKGSTPFTFSNPNAYLSQRAINRRNRYSIAIDSTDLPVTPAYINQIKAVANVTVLNVSKWLNAVIIQTSDAAAITTINGFSFVQSTTGIAAKTISGRDNKFFKENFLAPVNNITSRTSQTNADFYNYGTGSYNEIHLHNGEFLHNIGLRGQGMQIAMLDDGFNNYTSASAHAFDTANATAQVLGTWDFVHSETSVINDGSHGMNCFSTIVANTPGVFIGKAPKANFWLFTTEDDASEYIIEEYNWACGAERADSCGADVISTSLGYTDFDNNILSHVYADMNGNTTPAANAADLAAKKGILVFAAAGNDGSNSWHYLSTPSDGDSVIAVGAVNTAGAVGNFSSYGPSSDGQVKPDMASIGVAAMIQSGSLVITSNGTSFATPNMAGLGTILWQGFPEFNNMRIREALWKAGSITTAPNDRIGYGVPDLKKAFTDLLMQFASASASVTDCKVTLNWTSKDIAAMKYEIERKAPGEPIYTKIASVNPQAGVILTNHSYQKIDTLTNTNAGTISYRIRQILDTATATFTSVYTDTVNINLPTSCITTGINPVNGMNNAIAIIPNPAYDQFTLKVTTVIPVPQLGIYITDMRGQTVLQMQQSKQSGTANFTVPVAKLAKGKYVVSVYNGKSLMATKEFIKL